MKFLTRIWLAVRGRPESVPAAPPAPHASVPDQVHAAVPAPARRGRPASPALLRAIELVRRQRNITPRQIADELGISPDYARTLLRRAQAKVALPVAVAPVAAAPAPAVAPHLDAALAKLQERMEEAEQALANLRSTPPQARGAWNLHRRAEVLRLATAGSPPAEIAGALGIPPGEVDFILKVDRLLQSSTV